MTSNPVIDTADAVSISVLSVSPNEDDHSALQRVLGKSRWLVDKAKSLSTARLALRKPNISVVVCDCDGAPGLWVDMLDHLRAMPTPPSLIVTSRLADDRLWAEALNLGAWDVLAKPFDRMEMVRSVRYAWEHWRHHAQMVSEPMKVMRSAS